MSEAAAAVTESIVDAPADTSGGIDMDAAVAEIGAGLGIDVEDGPATTATDDPATSGAEDDAAAATTDTPPAAPTDRAMPKSWAKDAEELWKQTPDVVKDQIEKREKQMAEGIESDRESATLGRSLRDVIAPHQDMLHAAGVDAPKAVSFLLNAHRRLTTGTMESRQAAYADLGKNLGFKAVTDSAGNTAQENPELVELKQTVHELKSTINAEQQAKYDQNRTKIAGEVGTFAADNPYFDEVADDMTPFLKAGADLKTAYDKAIWANPVTRAKELARTQEASKAELLKKAKDEAEAARKAAGSNVRTRDTNKAPTEPKAKLFSADHDAEMREVVRKAGNRTH